jgi:hypothetical protein
MTATAREDYRSLQDDASVALVNLPPGAEDRARLMVQRLANQHGCQGLSCRRKGHQRDVTATVEVWRALGLAYDPLVPQDTYPGYGPRRPKRAD